MRADGYIPTRAPTRAPKSRNRALRQLCSGTGLGRNRNSQTTCHNARANLLRRFGAERAFNVGRPDVASRVSRKDLVIKGVRRTGARRPGKSALSERGRCRSSLCPLRGTIKKRSRLCRKTAHRIGGVERSPGTGRDHLVCDSDLGGQETRHAATQRFSDSDCEVFLSRRQRKERGSGKSLPFRSPLKVAKKGNCGVRAVLGLISLGIQDAQTCRSGLRTQTRLRWARTDKDGRSLSMRGTKAGKGGDQSFGSLFGVQSTKKQKKRAPRQPGMARKEFGSKFQWRRRRSIGPKRKDRRGGLVTQTAGGAFPFQTRRVDETRRALGHLPLDESPVNPLAEALLLH